MHPRTERVISAIRSGDYEGKIDRWDVMNNVRSIVANLVDLDLWSEEVEDYLYLLHYSAIDSL
jgi:hypothetical protein